MRRLGVAKMLIKKKLRDLRDAIYAGYEKRRLKNKSYVLISNNCWGYELYGSTRREYNTPFIGLYLMPDCYLRFLENFDYCASAELEFTRVSKYYPEPRHYPVGLIGRDIEIHFLHYTSETEALDKWTRRMARMRKAIAGGAEMYFKLCDCEGCTPAHLARFHALPFKHKLSLGFQEFKHQHHLHVPFLANSKGTALVDGAKLFKKRYTYFDITQWLLTGDLSRTLVSRLLALLP